MSSKHRRFQEYYGISSELMLALLQRQATIRCTNLGHRPSLWVSAKRKYGRAAKACQCVTCGAQMVITPYGVNKGPKLGKDAPAMLGDALFDHCVTKVPARQEPQINAHLL